MADNGLHTLCIYHILDGLRDGLSHFSQPSRVALLYAVSQDDPLRIYDPQNLLEGHEPKLVELFQESDAWRCNASDFSRLGQVELTGFESLQLAGLISFGARSRSVFYQMWFTEHHPDMCSIGPTERWLEHAAWLLSQDMAAAAPCIGSSGLVLQAYATHAVRDHIVDERNVMLGPDSRLRIYSILDAVLGISKTLEEGAWPRGELVFVEPRFFDQVRFLVRFPIMEQPILENHKHVRKLLLAMEGCQRTLVSDGKTIVGVAVRPSRPSQVVADFRGSYGFIRLGDASVCSFYDGSFHSSTRRAVLVQLEELLLESEVDPAQHHVLLQSIASIVHDAAECRRGCTLVLDMRRKVRDIPGQTLQPPLNLRDPEALILARSLAKVDGALLIGADARLHSFACLLDGLAVPGENRARGARFNSALRFSAMHDAMAVIVVSSDRPVSIMQGGMELTAQCAWKPMLGSARTPPLLSQWLEE